MLEIGTSGSMSGERKRGVAVWPKLPRLSSTLPMMRLYGYLAPPAYASKAGDKRYRSPRGTGFSKISI